MLCVFIHCRLYVNERLLIFYLFWSSRRDGDVLVFRLSPGEAVKRIIPPYRQTHVIYIYEFRN